MGTRKPAPRGSLLWDWNREPNQRSPAEPGNPGETQPDGYYCNGKFRILPVEGRISFYLTIEV